MRFPGTVGQLLCHARTTDDLVSYRAPSAKFDGVRVRFFVNFATVNFIRISWFLPTKCSVAATQSGLVFGRNTFFFFPKTSAVKTKTTRRSIKLDFMLTKAKSQSGTVGLKCYCGQGGEGLTSKSQNNALLSIVCVTFGVP